MNKADLIKLIEPLARMFFGEPNKRLSKTGELRFGNSGSKSVKLKTGQWFDHESNEGGGVLDLIKREAGVRTDQECFEFLESKNMWHRERRANGKGRGATPRKITVASYKYSTIDGDLAFVVDRIEYQNPDGSFVLDKESRKRKKTFSQKRPDPERPNRWIWNIEGVPPLIYRLLEVTEAIASEQVVVIVEGERKVDLLWKWNIAATCNPGGSNKWTVEHSEFLRGADVCLVPDNDPAGFAHLQTVGRSLTGIANSIRVVMLPGIGAKDDIVNWAERGGTHEQFDQLIERAPAFVPVVEEAPAAPSQEDEAKARASAAEQELIDRLAALSAAEYERQRKEAAKEHGFRASALDDMVERARRQRDMQRVEAPPFGDWVVEPWAEPVETAALLGEIVELLRSYVVMPAHFADAIALWVLFVWSFEVATHSPILLIASAEPNSGKSTLVGVIRFLSQRSMSTIGITEAALFRSIAKWHPTIGIDEADTILVENEALRAVVNSGWTRGSVVVRCVGDDAEPQPFSTFCPILIGMNGKRIPTSTKSRAIPIWLVRKLKSEKRKHFRHLDNNTFAQIRQRALRWSMDNMETLRDANPAIPQEFENRDGDNWRLQFAIADLAGREWRARADAAARAITGTSDTSSRNTRLLGAIRAIFDGEMTEGDDLFNAKPQRRDFVTSEGMIKALTADKDGEWCEWRDGKPITQAQLGRVLTDFGITTDRELINGRRPRGYRRASFEDVWARYPTSSSGPGYGEN